MRIVLMNDHIPPEGKGGAESVAWRLAQGLLQAGHEVHVVASTPNAPFEELRDGIPTYHLHANFRKRFRAWRSLWNPQTTSAFHQLLQRIQPDVVNAHNIHFYLSYHTLKIAYDLGIGTVFSSHDVMPFAYTKLTHFIKPNLNDINLPDDYRVPFGFNLRQNRLRYNPIRNIGIRYYLTHYAMIRTTPSQALADAHSANDLPPFTLAYNGINLDEWETINPDRVNALRQRLNLQDKKVILIAGRLTSHKGTVQLLSAMDQLTDKIPDMRLLVLTTGDIAQQIPPEYQHLRPFITSGGWLSGEELVAAYHLADVAVVPSVIFDTFPTVNLEAMAVGLPVIATCFGGSPEVVIDGETGYIINPFDTDLFADRLQKLLLNSTLRHSMGHKGQERTRDHFTLNHQVHQMVALYEEAIIKRHKDFHHRVTK
jgi:glycosyltransferase involved in cell wall biosynthesis